NGYYGWREGLQTQFTDPTGKEISPSPQNNAASVAFEYFFSRFLKGESYQKAISNEGFSKTYQELFGGMDWNYDIDHPLIPGNLKQPVFILPFKPGINWIFTGGPHSGWGIGWPFAAIDFAPPSETAGCDPSPYWAVATADGVISRSESGNVVLDLDGDGNSHTGWTVQYLHISPGNPLPVSSIVKTGDMIGHPSCIGGNSTGRNLHIARLYNGEWIPAGGVIPMVLGGWTVSYGEKEYKGSLSSIDKTIISSSSGEGTSQLSSDASN
ncbi:MAG TPA: hypothetical protein VF338_06835, partial [Leptolinea sp.]